MTNVFYEARYDGSSEPRIYKVVDVDGTEANHVLTAILLENTEEMEHISNDIVWNHIENLVEFMNSKVGSLSITPIGTFSDDGWPVAGWNDIDKLNTKINNWWYFLTRRDESHTHDPVA